MTENKYVPIDVYPWNIKPRWNAYIIGNIEKEDVNNNILDSLGVISNFVFSNDKNILD